MYDPTLARFMQQDTYYGKTSDPLSLNRYTYCSNNPLVYWDYTGHWQTGDEKYPDWIQERIRQATDDYYNATDQGGRDDAHAAALKLRKLGKIALAFKSEDTKITNNSSFHQEAKKRISNNQYFSKESWEKTRALSTSGSDTNNNTNSSTVSEKETNKVVSEKDSYRGEHCKEKGNKSYWEKYVEWTNVPFSNTIYWGVDVSKEYERYVLGARNLGDTLVDQEIFVNTFAPMWQQKEDAKTATDRLHEFGQVAVKSGLFFGSLFVVADEIALFTIGVKEFGFYNAAMMYQYGALKEQLAYSQSLTQEMNKGYQGIRNISADFKNGKKLKKHFLDHGDDFGYNTAEEYLQGSRNFLEKAPTLTTQDFISEGGTYFRYDLTTNEFGIINQYGGISTYFKPSEGLNYWTQQVELYMPK
jgi:hypothetical protein